MARARPRTGSAARASANEAIATGRVADSIRYDVPANRAGRTGAAFLSHGVGGSAENVLALLHLDKWAFRLGGDYVPHNYKKERHFNL
jgi:hypothetical protein